MANLLTVPSRFLLQPRYVWISWPSVLGAMGLFWQPLTSLLFLMSAYNWLRLHKLLPHERRWLKRAKREIRGLDYERALWTLRSRPVATGKTARIQATELLI